MTVHSFRRPLHLNETPVIRDARAIARELGIVDLLLTHQRIVYDRPAEAYDVIEECLIPLGGQ